MGVDFTFAGTGVLALQPCVVHGTHSAETMARGYGRGDMPRRGRAERCSSPLDFPIQ